MSSVNQIIGPINITTNTNGAGGAFCMCYIDSSNNIYYASYYQDECGNDLIIMDKNVGTQIINGSFPTTDVLVFTASNADKNLTGIEFTVIQPTGLPSAISHTTPGNVITFTNSLPTDYTLTSIYAPQNYPGVLLSSVPYVITNSLGALKFNIGDVSVTTQVLCTTTGLTNPVPVIQATVSSGIFFLPVTWYLYNGNQTCLASTTIGGLIGNSYCSLNKTLTGCADNDFLHFPAFSQNNDCLNNFDYTYCLLNQTCGTSNCYGTCSSSSDVCTFNSGNDTFSCTFSISNFVGSQTFWIIIGVAIGVFVIFMIVGIIIIVRYSRRK
jgi:hypothetical protein